MIKLDMWYGDDPASATSIDFTFYPNEGHWRGNIFKHGRIIGDYTATDSAELEKRFNFKFSD